MRAKKERRPASNRNHRTNAIPFRVGKGRSMAVVSVMLIVPKAEIAINWYKEAMGARELWNLGGVAGLEINGAPFFIHEVNPNNPSETSPVDVGVTSTRIELFVDDPDGFMKHVLTAGATIGSAIEDHRTPWGNHRQGGFKDPFGHNWSVGDKSPLSAFPA
jgi:PhnB protein